MSAGQAVSPELVLVGADRAEAIAALPERWWELFACPDTTSTRTQQEATSTARASIDLALITGIFVYLAWHALVGAILGLSAVVVVALGVMGLTAVAG